MKAESSKKCICYKEMLLLEYRSTSKEKRMSLYEEYPYMREIFNSIELKELDKVAAKEPHVVV